MFCTRCGARNEDDAKSCQRCGYRIARRSASTPPARESAGATPVTIQKGRYLIIHKLGSGGMGRVFLARDTKMDCNVVVKEMFPPRDFEDRKDYFKEKFIHEAKLLYRLAHRGIPKVLDYFAENDKYYIIMEYVEGENTENIIFHRAERRITIPEFIAWMDKILDILAYLHRQSPPILHRDIKPANIMVGPRNEVFLVDFGVSRTIQIEQDTSTRVGTMGYASPEHYSGKLVLASDIYSLGATFHYLLTGDPPSQRLPFDHPPLSEYRDDVPPGLEELLAGMLQKNPNDRFQNIDDLREFFNEFVESYWKIDDRASQFLDGGNFNLDSSLLEESQEPQKTDLPPDSQPLTEGLKEKIKTVEVDVPVLKKTPAAPQKIKKEIHVPIAESAPPEKKTDKNEKPDIQTKEEPDKKNVRKIGSVKTGIAAAAVLFVFLLSFYLFGQDVYDKMAIRSFSLRNPVKSAFIMDAMMKSNDFIIKDEYGKAIEILTDIINNDTSGEYPAARFGRARALFKAGRLRDAYKDINSFVSFRPDNKAGLEERARIAASLRMFDVAVSDYQKILSDDIGRSDADRIKAKLDDTVKKRGVENSKSGNYEKAFEDLEYITKKYPGDKEASKLFEKCCISLAEGYQKKNRTDKAIEIYSKALEAASDNPNLYIGRAKVLHDAGKIDEAKKDLVQALNYPTGNSNGVSISGILYSWGNSRIKDGDFSGGIKDIEEALKTDPKNSKIRNGLSKAYSKRAMSLYKNGDLKSSESNADAAIRINSDNLEALSLRAKCSLKSGKPDRSIDDATKIIKKDASYFEAYLIRGDAYAKKAEKDRAVADWKIAAKDGGNTGKEADKRLAEIRAEENPQAAQAPMPEIVQEAPAYYPPPAAPAPAPAPRNEAPMPEVY